MRIVYNQYKNFNEIPLDNCLKNKKIKKYLNLETASAICAVSNLLEEVEYNELMPFYYLMNLYNLEEDINDFIHNDISSVLPGISIPDFLREVNTVNLTHDQVSSVINDLFLENGKFSTKILIEKLLPAITPSQQFKLLANMPVSFISIVFNLHGDNATLYESSRSLLWHVLTSDYEGTIMVGCGKTHIDGSVESGFALVTKEEISNSRYLDTDICSIEMFKNWEKEGIH